MKKFLLCMLFIIFFTCPVQDVTAATAPTITRQPMPFTTFKDTMAEFSVTVTGTEPLRYQWQNSPSDDGIWSDIAGANSADYSFIATGIEMPFYRVVVSNDYGSVTSDRAMFNIIYPTPPKPQLTIDKHPASNTEVTEGSISDSISVEASIYSSGNIAYQWYSSKVNNYHEPGDPIPDATNAVFTIPTMLTASESPYYYYCVLEATFTSTELPPETEYTDVAMVTVNKSDSDNGGGCNGIPVGGGVSQMLIILLIGWVRNLLSEHKMRRL